MLDLLLFATAYLWLLVGGEEEAAAESTESTEVEALASFSDADLEKLDEGATKHQFEAEVQRLMEIIIHSLYTDRDIFLRELISNAADALDKIRYESLTNKDALGETTELRIRVQVDKEKKLMSITDTGVGMTAKELSDNLGTVARSGTARFLEAMSAKEEGGDNALNLIGQFGVGFYSSFLVADEVTVVSKSNNDEKQHVWRSLADGAFTVSEDPRGNTLGRGTQVLLKLKDDASEYLENDEIEKVVHRYSQFQTHPIQILAEKTEMKEKEYDELSEEEKALLEEDDDDLEVEDEEEEGDEEPEMEEVTVQYWKTINEQKPLWLRQPSDITDDEYQAFYKSFSKGSEDFLWKTHFRAEGQIEFSSILFIPLKAPHGLYDNYYTNPSKLSLYVRRVLVADEFEEFLPRYLSFVKGLVDSNDLPLNVNREQLQKNKIMKVISKKITRKALDMLHKMAEEEEGDDEDDEEDEEAEETEGEDGDDDEESDAEETPMKYTEFWKEFGKSVKLGVIEDSKNRKKLVQLLRFPSTRSPDTPISLQSYVDSMPDNQKNIYYISAANLAEAQRSPFLERVKAKGFEVLFFVENLDEYLNVADYEDYPLQSVTKEGLDLGESKAQAEYMEEKDEEFKKLTDWLKETYGDKVSKISLSNRLENTPMIIPTGKYGQTANMERISAGQAFGRGSQKATKILEINFRHPVIKALKTKVDAMEEDGEDQDLVDYAQMLYDVALVNSGFTISADAVESFSTRMERVVRGALDVDPDAEVEALPEFADDEEEEEDEDEDEEEEEEEDLDEEEEDGEEGEGGHDEL